MANGDVWRDSDGYIWYEGPGKMLYEKPADMGMPGRATTKSRAEEWWAPLTKLNTSSADLSAPATRGDIVRVLEALSQVANADGNTHTAQEIARWAAEIKEGRA